MFHIAAPRVVLALHGALSLHPVDDVADQFLLLLLARVLQRARHALPVAPPRRLSVRPVSAPVVLRLQVRLEAALRFVGDAAVFAFVRVPRVGSVLVSVPVVSRRYLPVVKLSDRALLGTLE